MFQFFVKLFFQFGFWIVNSESDTYLPVDHSLVYLLIASLKCFYYFSVKSWATGLKQCFSVDILVSFYFSLMDVVSCRIGILSSTFPSLSMITEETKWTQTGIRFQTGVKASSVHMTFYFGYISKRPDILMDMLRCFIRVAFIWYFLWYIHIFFLSKWPIWNPYP